MATQFSMFALKIPWTEEPSGLQSIGSQRVRHNWAAEQGHMRTCGYVTGPFTDSWKAIP